MSELRKTLTHQTAIQPPATKPAWTGNLLFIIGCAMAAAAATVIFTPRNSNPLPNLPSAKQVVSQPMQARDEPKAKPVENTSQTGDEPTSNAENLALPDPMTFRYRGNTKLEAAMDFDFRFIYAEGAITPGTAERFAAFLRSNSITPGAVVIFDSPGGLVSEAMDLGKEIREAGLSTSVKEINLTSNGKIEGPLRGCFSSCTLAFLGGAERTVPPKALFGVHQLSTNAAMSPAEALQFGQSAMGIIIAYASEMGTKAQFISELTRATPDGINLLVQTQLAALNVTTPEFQTAWEIESSSNGHFYLLAATRTHGGVDNIGLTCGQSGPEMTFFFNTSGKYLQDTLDYTSDYGLEFDDSHVDLLPSEIIHPVTKLSDEYVAATIALSPRILDYLLTANRLTFEMMMPSHTTYSGWTTDFASGRDQFFSFLKSCQQ